MLRSSTISETTGPPVPGLAPPGHQWQRRPLLSRLVRLAVVAGPAAAGLGTAALLSRLLPRPTSVPQALFWFAGVSVAMLLAVLAVERAARRLLPLAALLNLSLLFPDRAPKRFAVARRVGRPRDLQRQLQEARDKGTVGGELAYMQRVLELVAALSVHDRQTRGHSERVRVFADLIAEEMKLSAPDQARLRWASLLHDIGKLVVPSEILSKPAALSTAEWQDVRRHPEEGSRLIGPLRSWLGEWALAVEHHHERWDGRGYPFGLAGDRISLAGRIVAVADSYEVMTAVRPYRRPLGVVAARQELVRCSGKQFDPVVVRAFLNISVGRLWRVVGFGSWIAQLPLIAWVNDLGLQWGTAIVSGSTALGLAAPGLLPGTDPSPRPQPGPPAISAAQGTRSGSAAAGGGGGAGPASVGSSAGLAPRPGTVGPATVAPGSGPVLAGTTATPPPQSPVAQSGPGPQSSPSPAPPGPAPTLPPGTTPTPTPAPTPTPGPVTRPTVAMPAPATIFEGSYTAGGSFADAGGSGWTATVNYGDGSGARALSLSGYAFTLQHTYVEVCACTVTVTVTNARLGYGSASTGVTVKSAPVAITMPAGGGLAVLGGFNASGSYSDADTGADTYSATVDYGDGSGLRPLVLSSGYFALSHTYSTLLQTYTVTVTITDDDGAVARATTTVLAVL
ncbi:MAG TPA: HD domain-containing phosphohydrolase [Candidatus Dormibacteraeota bacterium]|nr:HD domain-containing phosphohydrolase [Candidatus Dormibacteraeota bacterium]